MDDGVSRRADRDLALLQRPELRPVRLLLEYWKPELALSDLKIDHTVVVFGSTRLQEHDRYYEEARELGRLIGRAGAGTDGHRLVVVTGGGPGAMEAANRGAQEVGAPSGGFNISLPREQEPNSYVSPELCFEFRYFALRKLHFVQRARALVAFPGGYGTLDELFEVLCLIQTGKHEPLPVVLVGERHWKRVIDFDFLVEEGYISAADRGLFQLCETAREAWEGIVAWYRARGEEVVGR
jgi:uncharacterized protein (TIGR00730 family)